MKIPDHESELKKITRLRESSQQAWKSPVHPKSNLGSLKKQVGGVPFVIMVIITIFFAGGTLGAFVAWWMGANTPTIVFSAFAFGIIIGLVFIPNAVRVIRWFKAVKKELSPAKAKVKGKG